MPAAHKRLSFTGTLGQAVGGGQEIFEFTMASTDTMSLKDAADAGATAMLAAWEDGTHAISISAHATFGGCRAEAIAADGKVTGSYYSAASTPGVTGLNSNMLNTIVCNAVTLVTSSLNGHGRTVLGRIYPPGQCSQIIGATSTLQDAQQLANGWGYQIKQLNAAGLAIAVASKTVAGLSPVIGCSVDTVIDTQRRRKNHVSSQRSTVVSIS